MWLHLIAERCGVELPAQDAALEAGQLERVSSNGLFGRRRADRTRTRARTRTRTAVAWRTRTLPLHRCCWSMSNRAHRVRVRVPLRCVRVRIMLPNAMALSRPRRMPREKRANSSGSAPTACSARVVPTVPVLVPEALANARAAKSATPPASGRLRRPTAGSCTSTSTASLSTCTDSSPCCPTRWR
jgi:hypothetical protein